MARQVSCRSAADTRRAAVSWRLVGRLFAVDGLLPAVCLTLMLVVPCQLKAESLASKNKEGNRLFAQGKYEAAEKAYLDAQVKNPGTPEILYNLGNSLIRQKKNEQGMQALRQSIDKGNTEIKKNSWYNTGNALFSMGNFRDSAGAFIEALRLDPGDMDAKHNLELALKKLQQQNRSQSNQKQQDGKASNRSEAASGEEGEQPQREQKARDESGNRQEQDKRLKQQASQLVQREGSMSREQAMQILDALQNQELEQQRKLLERRAGRKTNEKDW